MLYRLRITLLFLIVPPCLLAQSDQVKFDSLINILDESASDSILFVQFLELSKNSAHTDVALRYGMRALEKAQKIGFERGIAKSYLRLGNVKTEKGDLGAALEDVLAALEFYNKAQLENPIAVCLNIIGLILTRQGDYNKAIEYINRAIVINKRRGRLKYLANDYNNIGEAYRLWPVYDSALFYFNQALKLYKNINEDYGVAYATGNIGLVYAAQGDYDLAEERIDESTEILERLGDYYPIAVYMTYLVDISLERGNKALALGYAEQSLKIGIDYGLKEQIRDASKKLAELYREGGDYQKAFEYQSQYLAYRDSINSEETIRRMADMRTEYEVAQKQTEVDLLNLQKRTQQAIGTGLAAVLVLTVALAFVLYRNNKKKIKINRLLEEQKDQLEEINHTKDKFFSIISHDLRGPVNSFRGISRIIKAYISSGKTDELIEVTKDIDKSVEGLSDLLDNLLSWAIQQQGRVPNVPEKVSLNEIVVDLFKTFHNMARAKDISLESSLEGEVILWVDRNSAMTILRNIVNNALKFTGKGGVVRVDATQEGDFALIKISDTGTGIPKDKLKGLFELKATQRSWGTHGEQGLGLGLQLVNEFIQMNSGRIKVESEVGKGTSFIVCLPLFEKESFDLKEMRKQDIKG